MKQLIYFIVITTAILSASAALAADPDSDKLMGKVTMGSKFKPDAKSRKGVVAIASKIMKLKEAGAIRVRGDFPGAENADDYLLKSVFMAREIEQQLKPLLKNRFQVFVMASKYSGVKKADPNIVEIFFYPRELKVEDMQSLRYKSVQQKEPSREIAAPVDQPQKPEQPAYEAVEQTPERAEPDNLIKDSKKMRVRQDTEDPTHANELVNKVKARAAERAKRDALESAPTQ